MGAVMTTPTRPQQRQQTHDPGISVKLIKSPYEQCAGSSGQASISLPEEVRRAVREEVRRDLGDMGGAIEVEVEIRFGSGRR